MTKKTKAILVKEVEAEGLYELDKTNQVDTIRTDQTWYKHELKLTPQLSFRERLMQAWRSIK